MARLCRIHLTGLGRESARFNPLTADLRDQRTGTPQDAVIWLRNGGGKTTLISLLYSLLVPNASQFLGKLTGKGARLEDFLRPDQLAVIATEWDLSAMGAPRRTIGQVMLLKNRELLRFFFSFSETREFGFNQLPVLGLATAAKSFDALQDALLDAQRRDAALDLVIAEKQNEWSKHLSNLGMEPALFRAHLVMNGQEGGATEIFKIKTPEDFVRRFFELVYDEQGTAELEKSLALFREKMLRNPSYRAAVEFGEALLKDLRPFAQDAQRQRELSHERTALDEGLTQLAVAIAAHTAKLDEDIDSLEKQHKGLSDIAAEKEKKAQRATRLGKGYEKRGCRLRVEETERIYAAAGKMRVQEERKLALLRAAKACKIWRAARAELDALLKSLERLRLEHRPELEQLRHLGALLLAAWTARVESLDAEQQELANEAGERESELEELRNEKTTQTARRAKAEANRDECQRAIRAYEEAQRKLRQDNVLLDEEDGTAASARWQADVERHTAQVKRLGVEVETAGNRIRAIESSVGEMSKKRGALEADLREYETTLYAEERKRHELEAMPLLRELAEGATPDLRNPYLLERLDSTAAEAQGELIRLAIEAADDQRDDHALERLGLFAPNTDVEEILARLSHAGITSALPLYRWLAEHFAPDKAAELLRQHPAAYAGVLVQNPVDLDRARETLAEARIRAPVVLLAPNDLPRGESASVSGHTVVPAERGLFSRTEAARARPSIERRRLAQGERREEAEQRRQDASALAASVRDYLREYPAKRLEGLNAEVESLRAQNATLKEEIERQGGELSQARIKRDTDAANQLRAQELLGEAGQKKQAAATFVSSHEEGVGDQRKFYDYHQQQFLDADQTLGKIDEEIPVRLAAIAAIREQAVKLSEPLSVAKQARGALPVEYIGEPPSKSAVPTMPEELAPEFHQGIRSYEGKIQKGQLEGRIEVQQKTTDERRNEYDQQRGQLSEQEAEAIAHGGGLDASIERQQQTLKDAEAAETRAESAFSDAKRKAPSDRDFKEGENLDQDRDTQPATAADSEIVAQQYHAAAAILRVEVAQARGEAETAQARLGTFREARPYYEGWRGQLPAPDSYAAPHAAFTGVVEEDKQLVGGMLKRKGELNQQIDGAERKLNRRYDSELQPRIHSPEYDRFRIPFRDRLKLLKRDDFVAKADEQITALEAQLAACQNELDAEEQERRIIVEKLDNVARRAASLLSQAETVSTMPESLGPWARQPFLRVSVPRKGDLTERQILLKQAVERWFEAAEIPSGHLLAYECLLAVCGKKTIGVRILKPEYQLSPQPHDIMELVKFSDGEKLTAAILLYCVLVRLRARLRERGEQFFGKDSGMLLLDNPFGKATLAEFVDLQVRMARLMGVQLIYATGINDFTALKHFPHFVRLRNSSRGRSSNDYHVTLDPRPMEEDKAVEGIAVGRSETARPDEL